ncbi:MAG TPA: proton-translocating transhydrogenase family protein [Polyangia bacterium]
MTGGLLISMYLFTLAAFLGLDVIRKVPPTLYGALAAVIGASAALSVVIAVVAAAAGGKQAPAILGTAAVAAGTCGVVGGLVRGKRMLRTLGGKPGGKA